MPFLLIIKSFIVKSFSLIAQLYIPTVVGNSHRTLARIKESQFNHKNLPIYLLHARNARGSSCVRNRKGFGFLFGWRSQEKVEKEMWWIYWTDLDGLKRKSLFLHYTLFSIGYNYRQCEFRFPTYLPFCRGSQSELCHGSFRLCQEPVFVVKFCIFKTSLIWWHIATIAIKKY